MVEPVLKLVVLDKSGTVLDTFARSVTTYNTSGQFDILPGHTNFISLIQNNVTYEDTQGKRNDFKVNQALLKVVMNKIEIFLSI